MLGIDDAETALFYGFICLFILVIITLILLLIHSGFFVEIDVQTGKPCLGQIQIAYKSARGPYKQSGALFTEVHTLLPHYRTIGVYYDDPKKKESNQLRYIVGIIIAENDEPVKEEDRKILEEWNYKFATFPSIQHAVQTSVPFKSTLSIIVAVFRVYPILDEYIEMRSLCVHPIMEVYDNEKQKIFFVGPLEKQSEFYVPEVLQDDKPQVEDDDDDKSSVSWDDSASYLKSEGCDSESLVDESLPNIPMDQSVSDAGEGLQAECEPSAQNVEDSKAATHEPNTGESTPSQPEDDSDNTGSSFEEIDKEAPEIKKEVVQDLCEQSG